MYFTLHSEIKIGNIKMRGVNDVTIRESIHEYANKCTIKLPTSAVLKYAKQIGEVEQPSIQNIKTANQFKSGDKVFVNLGYNGILKQEFVGFVTRINRTTPVEIECEGYSYLLRKKKNIKKSWKTTTLKEVLNEVVKGTEIKLHDKIPEIPLKNLLINNASGTQVIDYLKELLKDTITAFFIDNVLFVGLTYTDITEGKTVKYSEGKNVISDDALKYHEADDIEVKIEFKHNQPDGTKKQGTQDNVKTGGIIRTEIVSAVDDTAWLTKMAKAKLAQETFDGYEGEITTFLIPYCRVGYRAEYRSKKYPQKNGNYFVEGATVNFSTGGARRIPELGLKLS